MKRALIFILSALALFDIAVTVGSIVADEKTADRCRWITFPGNVTYLYIDDNLHLPYFLGWICIPLINWCLWATVPTFLYVCIKLWRSRSKLAA
jgi:hypothetical protein